MAQQSNDLVTDPAAAAGIPVTNLVTPGASAELDPVTNEQVRMQLSGQPVSGKPGQFEIMAITAGNGNGWNFTETCLQSSLALWEGAEVFIDHSYWLKSVRDLAGVLHSPSWDGAAKGIKLQLRSSGPSGGLLEAMGRDWLDAAEGQRPRIGFSADVFFTSKGKDVQQIIRVNSVDLVYNPARGGAFLRALNQLQESFTATPSGGGKPMGEENSNTATAAQTQLNQDLAAVQSLLQVQQDQAKLAAEAEAARAVRAQMCAYLLDSGLAASKLPAAMAEHVRGQFAGMVFEPAALTKAIDDARKLVADLQGGGVVQGARIHGMLSSEDRLQAAVDDLLQAPREAAMEGKQVERLSGIRELYLGMTGDYDLHGGFYGERAQFATTTTMASVVKNALNKSMVNQWKELGKAGYNWWEKIAIVEHYENLNQITGVLVGEVTLLPSIPEGNAYGALNIEDSEEVGNWTKYGGYLPLTLELIDRDDVARLRAYPKKLANSGIRRISNLIGSVFTSNAGVGPTMADGVALFNAANHFNLGTTALASAEWEVASAAIYNQSLLVFTGDTAPKLACDARYCLVPRGLRLTAMQILYPQWERQSQIFSENLQKGELGDVVVCPEFTDVTDWAAIADPKIAPAIIIGERFGIMPEIFVAGDQYSPAMFTNDELRLKARHFLNVMVADYRPLYKENVAG